MATTLGEADALVDSPNEDPDSSSARRTSS